MALIKCPKCGREISEYDPVCPYCGKPMQSYSVVVPKKKGHGCLWTILVFVALVFILALTCPSKEEHAERISSELTSLMLSELNKNDDTGIGTLFASVILGPVVDGIIDQGLVVDSYGIVSVGRIKNADNGKDRFVSFGIFNYIHTLIDEEFVKSAVDDAMK